MEKSALAEHAWENHHPIDLEETTVLDHGTGHELLVKENFTKLRQRVMEEQKSGALV